MSSCNYASLSRYNAQYSGIVSGPDQMGPQMTYPPFTGVKPGSYIVPAYSAIGYSTLQHNQNVPSCNGYFTITSAYGANAGNCQTQYMNSPCM